MKAEMRSEMEPDDIVQEGDHRHGHRHDGHHHLERRDRDRQYLSPSENQKVLNSRARKSKTNESENLHPNLKKSNVDVVSKGDIQDHHESQENFRTKPPTRSRKIVHINQVKSTSGPNSSNRGQFPHQHQRPKSAKILKTILKKPTKPIVIQSQKVAQKLSRKTNKKSTSNKSKLNREILSRRHTHLILSYCQNKKQQQEYLQKTLPTIPQIFPKDYKEDGVMLKRFADTISRNYEELKSKFQVIEKKLAESLKIKKITAYQNMLWVEQILVLLSISKYFERLIMEAQSKSESNQLIGQHKFQKQWQREVFEIVSIYNDLYILKRLLVYQHICEEYIDAKSYKSKQQKQNIIFQLKKDLDFYYKQPKGSAIIRIFANQQYKICNEAIMYNICIQQSKRLKRQKRDLLENMEGAQQSLMNQRILLMKIMKTVNILNEKIPIKNYEFFEEQLKADLAKKQTFTNEVVNIVFDIIDKKLNKYDSKNQQIFKKMNVGSIRTKIWIISEITNTKRDDNENCEFIQELLSTVDKNIYKENFIQYQEHVLQFKEFIRLKQFFLNFLTVTNKIAGFILDKEKITFLKSLQDCHIYLQSFEQVNTYFNQCLSKEVLENSKHNSIFKKYHFIAESINQWRLKMDQTRLSLKKFFQDTLQTFRMNYIPGFYKTFSIKSTKKGIIEYDMQVHRIMENLKKIDLYIKLVSGSEKEAKSLHRQYNNAFKIMIHSTFVTHWIRDQYTASISTDIQQLQGIFSGDYLIEETQYSFFIKKFIKKFKVFIQEIKDKTKEIDKILKPQLIDADNFTLSEIIDVSKLEANLKDIKQLEHHIRFLQIDDILVLIMKTQRNNWFYKKEINLLQKYYPPSKISAVKGFIYSFRLKLNLFLRHFDKLQKNWVGIFDRLEILDKNHFEKNMGTLKTKICAQELHNFKKFLQLLWEILCKYKEDEKSFFTTMKPQFIKAKWQLSILKGQNDFIHLLNNFHENMIVASLYKRIAFYQVHVINQSFEDFVQNFKKEKADVRIEIEKINNLLALIDAEILYHYDIKRDPHLIDTEKSLTLIKKKLVKLRLTCTLSTSIFYTSVEHQKILENYLKLQNLIISKNEGIQKMLNHESYGLILQAMMEYKQKITDDKIFSNINRSLISYITKVEKMLESAIDELTEVKNNMSDFQILKMDDIMVENANIITFVQAMRQYFLSSRDNIIFIYTNKVNIDNDCPLLFTYEPGETLIDIYRKFTRQFLGNDAQFIRQNFLKAQLRFHLSQTWVVNAPLKDFEDWGPVDMFINLTQIKSHPDDDPMVVKFKGSVSKQPYMENHNCVIILYRVTNRVYKINSMKQSTGPFVFEQECMPYPHKYFIEAQLPGQQFNIERFACGSINCMCENRLDFHPFYEQGEKFRIYLVWQIGSLALRPVIFLNEKYGKNDKYVFSLKNKEKLDLVESKGILMKKETVQYLKNYIVTIHIYENIKESFHLFMECASGYFTTDKPKPHCYFYQCEPKDFTKIQGAQGRNKFWNILKIDYGHDSGKYEGKEMINKIQCSSGKEHHDHGPTLADLKGKHNIHFGDSHGHLHQHNH